MNRLVRRFGKKQRAPHVYMVVIHEQALALQKQLLQDIHGQLDAGNTCTHDHAILLQVTLTLQQHTLYCTHPSPLSQHPPVYTLGAGSTLDNLRFSPDAPPFPLYRTERGGEVTYHGPGQLVLYPIVNLRNHQQDLHWYLRGLEEIVIRCVAWAH